MLVNSWNSGVMRATPGNMEAPRMKPSTRYLNLKFSRASAYAANTPMSSDTRVTTPPMNTLFSRAWPNLLPNDVSNAVLKLSRVTWLGRIEVSYVKPTSRKAVTTIQYAGARHQIRITAALM